MCFISGKIKAKGAHTAGQSWTLANIDGAYLPSQNTDLACSDSSNVAVTVYAWSDGQIVCRSQANATNANDDISFSGFWRY